MTRISISPAQSKTFAGGTASIYMDLTANVGADPNTRDIILDSVWEVFQPGAIQLIKNRSRDSVSQTFENIMRITVDGIEYALCVRLTCRCPSTRVLDEAIKILYRRVKLTFQDAVEATHLAESA